MASTSWRPTPCSPSSAFCPSARRTTGLFCLQQSSFTVTVFSLSGLSHFSFLFSLLSFLFSFLCRCGHDRGTIRKAETYLYRKNQGGLNCAKLRWCDDLATKGNPFLTSPLLVCVRARVVSCYVSLLARLTRVLRPTQWPIRRLV
jgi:hypothetical protein